MRGMWPEAGGSSEMGVQTHGRSLAIAFTSLLEQESEDGLSVQKRK